MKQYKLDEDELSRINTLLSQDGQHEADAEELPTDDGKKRVALTEEELFKVFERHGIVLRKALIDDIFGEEEK